MPEKRGKNAKTIEKSSRFGSSSTFGGVITPTITANAAQWRNDARGWWIENDDGSYLVNQWYQSPSSGLWYYMGSDGYMLTNTMTPDGCYVDANGVWNPATNQGTQQTAGAVKDVAAIRKAAEAYNDWYNSSNMTITDSFVFYDIDSDGMPECIATNGNYWIVATQRGGNVTTSQLVRYSQPYYVPGGNVLCKHSSSNNGENREFFEINDKGRFMADEFGCQT